MEFKVKAERNAKMQTNLPVGEVAQKKIELPPITFTPQKVEIIAAARDLLSQYGYDGLSIRELAQRSGLATATIYHHFRDKEDILLHVLEYDALTAHTCAMDIASSEQDVVTKLQTLIRGHVLMFNENRLTFVSSVRRLETMEKMKYWFQTRMLPQLLEPFVAIIEQGVQQGVFRAIDSRMTAVAMLGMCHSLCTFSLLLVEQDMTEVIVAHVQDLVMHGVSAYES